MDISLSTENVKKALDRAPLQVKLGMALEAFSGFRPSDAVRLTFGHFKPEPSQDRDVVAISFKTKKGKGRMHVTFCFEQTLNYLAQWKKVREDRGEVITNDTRLFFWSTAKSMSAKLTDWLKKSDIEVRKGFRLRNYCLQKYFKMKCTGYADRYLVEFFMAHKIKLPGVYMNLHAADKEALDLARTDYMKAIPNLTTEGMTNLRQLEGLRDELNDKQKEIEVLKNRILETEMFNRRYLRDAELIMEEAEMIRTLRDAQRQDEEEPDP